MGRLAGILTRSGGAGVLALSMLVAFTAMSGTTLGTISTAQAQEATSQKVAGPVIRRIVVKGNQRIERDTILSYMTLKEGDGYNAALIDESLKTLFATGLFADITMRPDGSTLLVSVVENPIINRVAYEGNKAIDNDAMNKEVQLKARVIYTRAKVQADVSRIIELYRRGGRFGATVEPKVIQLPQNRVDLVFEINEGDKTKIASINFLGNKEFDDGDLRDVVSTTESAWWKFFSSSDSYDPDRLIYDRELLRRYYLSKGYADFRVVNAVADLNRQGTAFHITFTVDEGEIYDFGTIELKTNIKKLDPAKLEKLIQTEAGETYNASLIDKSVDALAFASGTQGYAFAQVRPQIRREREKKLVNITYTIEEGPRVYVERINVTGNVRTLDKVIRRNIRMSEGDAFNKVLLDKSEKNIRALDYFEKVEMTQENGSASDKTIVNVAVEEKSTGSLSLSFGFSSVDSLIAGVSLSEKNLLGRGVLIGSSVSISRRRLLTEVHYTDPYFLDRNLVGGVDLFGSETDYQDEASFDSSTRGFGLRFGFPLAEKTRFLVRYQLRHDKIFNVAAFASNQVVEAAGGEVRSIIGYDFYYDDRNDPVEPTGGWDFLVSQDFAGLGGSVSYVSSQVLAHYYYNVADGWLSTLRLDGGYILGIGEDVRLNDRYFKGGDDFRGFKAAGIGPRDILTDDALGGQAYIFGTAELRIPNGLPDSLGIKTSVFTDIGYIGVADTTPTAISAVDKFAPRMSAGFSLYWKSPFGPIRIDLSRVLIDEPYDEREFFRFSAGTNF
jgi:outer membrane protein insertion porin family